ncbi:MULTISPECIES: sodium:solute symporter family transporter [Brevibacillus]|uniref:Sodium:solute symporter n=1 Tax=Brevibacillus parabrevis TaxID=54914 RepID=A0A4Y3PQ96_BREPA|nr:MULTISPECIES: transporter [Brevibacillus]MBU8712972.1 transporter [Brevibacillus parabrevis]MDH6348490.1 Na+/proline symporter [Brevibacillus sp. 1238]MDR5002362.1 transporter [Brevibacillus parabrevis]MED2256419.1 transporter [Brevibacillus parabrevis]RNB96825.1 transporter [Brevibacillus parabrevis]
MTYLSFREYVLGAAKIGIGLGAVSILARWVTGNTIFGSPEALVKYGIFGGIGFALMGAVALCFFGLLGRRVRREFSEGMTIGDYLQGKLHPFGYWLMIILLLLTTIEAMFVQGMAGGVLLNILFGLPIPLGLLCFFVFSVLFAGIGGIRSIHRFAIVQIVITFAAAILIPVYFFIGKGVEHVYNGLRLYHPYLLVASNKEGLLFIVTGLLIGFGQVFSDQASWQRLYMMEEKKIVPTFLLSGLIFATVPLAFSSLIIIVIFTGGFDDIYSLMFDLVRKIDSMFLLVLFVLCSFGAIMSAFGAGLHSMISLMVNNVYQLFRPRATERQKIRTGYMLAIMIGAVSFGLTSYFKPTLLDLLFFFGIIYASLILPLIVIVWSRGKASNFILISAVVGQAAGYVSRAFVDPMKAIWIASFATAFFLVGYLSITWLWRRYFRTA